MTIKKSEFKKTIVSEPEQKKDSIRTLPVRKLMKESDITNHDTLTLDTNSERDFSQYTVSKATNRKGAQKRTFGAISLVYAKTGNRLTLSKEIITELGHPESVQLIYNEQEIIIGTNLIPESSSHKVSYQNERGIIYSKHLVKELIDYYKIDFINRTSCSLGVVNFENNNHQNDNLPFAVITNIKGKHVI